MKILKLQDYETEWMEEALDIAERYYKREIDIAFEEDEEGLAASFAEGQICNFRDLRRKIYETPFITNEQP